MVEADNSEQVRSRPRGTFLPFVVFFAALSTIALLMAFLYVPIWVLIAFSFSSSRSLTWPIPGFTLDWYRKLFANEDLQAAVWNSFYVATFATILSLIVGVAAAYPDIAKQGVLREPDGAKWLDNDHVAVANEGATRLRDELAGKIARNSPAALRATKRAASRELAAVRYCPA